jgi:hypothetical protein
MPSGDPDPKQVAKDIENAAARLRSEIAPPADEQETEPPPSGLRGLVRRVLARIS